MPNETDLETITVSGVTKPLLRELQKLAEREHRSRSNYIVKTLAEAVRDANAAKRPKVQAA